jgi:HD-like signal output (HDOD) protein
MNESWPIAIGVVIAATVAIAIVWLLRRRVTAPVGSVSVDASAQPASASTIGATEIAFQSEATVQVFTAAYALAFSVPHFEYQILGPHKEVLDAAKEAVASAVHEAKYFPRKPALLPKLLHALNAGDATRQELVRLILQDPVLAGNVLKRANSAYYRKNDNVIESIERAVVLLGSEGLRAPVATAVMQPVFQLPRGFFDQFAPMTWEIAQRTAIAAEVYARVNRVGDAFVAHLLGLIGGLGRIVLFRMTLDKYRNHNILPRAEVFIRVMREHEYPLTRAVAAAWELSPTFLAAFDEQQKQTPPQRMTPLAKTLYYATLCGTIAVLTRRDNYSPEDAHALVIAQGLDANSLDAMWSAANDNTLYS